MSTTADPSGRVTTMSYDAAGQITSVSYSDGLTPGVTYGCDPVGNMVSMTDGTGTTTWTFDTFNELVTKTQGSSDTVQYGHDNAGNITSITYPGQTTPVARLATTLCDHHQYPAAELIRLYHQRWEIETAYLELKSSILCGRVLRARTPTEIEQEIYAQLVTYQLLRTAMTDATNTQPDTDPDRASFTIAYQTARDQLVHAANVPAGTAIDLVGTISRHVLADLLPGPRTQHQPDQLQGHRQHRHPDTRRTLTIITTAALLGQSVDRG